MCGAVWMGADALRHGLVWKRPGAGLWGVADALEPFIEILMAREFALILGKEVSDGINIRILPLLSIRLSLANSRTIRIS